MYLIEIDKKWQTQWEKNGVYHWLPQINARSANYSIDTPPPTVSGSLHMGHVCSYIQPDIAARFKRMQGYNVFYPIGFDDNGLPTERLVEKLCGVKASQTPRDEFLRLCADVSQQSCQEFEAIFRSLGMSFDWNQVYRTNSKKSHILSQMSFIDLYNKGLVYKQAAPVFWDVIDATALSQADIEDKEKAGVMYNIPFTCAPKAQQGESSNSSGETAEITIATTRPELLAACVALLVHPEDARYAQYIGQQAATPIYGASVPIIADTDVDPEKGTGAVMCCTFGDIQDVTWWKKHHLPIISCVNDQGTMQNAGQLNGLKINAARIQIVELLGQQGKIHAQQEVIRQVKCGERSGAPVEILITQQWYIQVLKFKEEILQKSAECNWFPKNMEIKLQNWVRGLNQDWCISRQRKHGVAFPVWYSRRLGEEGKILLPTISQLPVDPQRDLPLGYSREEVIADTDVMDTWATSAISPQLATGCINEEFYLEQTKHKALFPFDMRPQAHEIIRTWTFVTLVKALHHGNSIPWHNIMISGWCLAQDKSKMSKSKGNIVEPKSLISEYGADVIRYWSAQAKLGNDVVFSEDPLKIGKKMINKLWNAGQFCAMHVQEVIQQVSPTDHNPTEGGQQYLGAVDAAWRLDQHIQTGVIHTSIDLWFAGKLLRLAEEVTEDLNRLDYAEARSRLESFFWRDFCDNYLELIKAVLYQEKGSEKWKSAVYCLISALLGLLKLFAPFLPHITEELYQSIFYSEQQNSQTFLSLHRMGNWTNYDSAVLKQEKLQNTKVIGENTIVYLELLRKFKSIHKISVKKPLDKVMLYSRTANLLDPIALERLQTTMSIGKLEVVENASFPDKDSSASNQLLYSDCGNFAVFCDFTAE